MTEPEELEYRRSSQNAGVGPLRIADARVYIDTADPDFAATAAWSFRDLAEDSEAPSPGVTHIFSVNHRVEPWSRWEMLRDEEVCQLALDEGYVLFHLQWEFNRIVLERRQATVHAAAAEFEGRTIVFPGQSRSGKTTLAGYLAAQGAVFVADEIVAITQDFEAMPYVRPLGVRAGGPLSSLFTHPDVFDRRFDTYEMLVPASALGPRIELLDRPSPIAAVIFPRYERDAATDLRRVSKSDALERLCAGAPGIARHGREVFLRLGALIERVPTAELVLSDLESAEAAIGDFLSVDVRNERVL